MQELKDHRLKAGLEYFERAGAGGNTTLSGHELKLAIAAATGIKYSKYEVAKLLKRKKVQRVISSDENYMTRDEFMETISRQLALADEAKVFFRAFDTRDKGFVTFDDLKRVFTEANPDLSETEIADAFCEGDTIGQGRISYEQFISLFSSRCKECE